MTISTSSYIFVELQGICLQTCTILFQSGTLFHLYKQCGCSFDSFRLVWVKDKVTHCYQILLTMHFLLQPKSFWNVLPHNLTIQFHWCIIIFIISDAVKTYPLFSNPTNLSSCKVTTKSTVFIKNIYCFLTLYGEDGNNTTENYDVFSIPSIINMIMIPALAFTSALYVTLISCLQSYIVQLYDI